VLKVLIGIVQTDGFKVISYRLQPHALLYTSNNDTANPAKVDRWRDMSGEVLPDLAKPQQLQTCLLQLTVGADIANGCIMVVCVLKGSEVKRGAFPFYVPAHSSPP